MGLDNYFQDQADPEREIEFPAHNLCGANCFLGLNSFRGNVYSEFFEKNLDVDLYMDMPPSQVAQVAHSLNELLAAHPQEAWNPEKGWQANLPSCTLGDDGVTAQAVEDLVKIFSFAGKQGLSLIADY